MRADQTSERPENQTIGARLRRLLWGCLRMALVWAGIGVVSGVLAAPRPITPISIIAGVIAGLIIFTPVGALLGVFAARRVEVVLTALIGLCLGATVALCLGREDVAATANQGLILGGLAGATMIPIFFRLPGWLMRQVRQPESPTSESIDA